MASKQLSTIRRWVLSSPPAEWALNQLRELLIGAIKQGKVPRHVAFVMDGNRRYARSHRIETVEGHNLGFEALARVRKFVLGHVLANNKIDLGGLLQIRRPHGYHLRLQHRKLQAQQIRSRRPDGYGKDQTHSAFATWRAVGPIWCRNPDLRPKRASEAGCTGSYGSCLRYDQTQQRDCAECLFSLYESR